LRIGINLLDFLLMESWDPFGLKRVEQVRDRLVEVRFVSYVRGAAQAVWRANRDRHEPNELFDDSYTISQLSTRNLANRVHQQVSGSKTWKKAGVLTRWANNAVIVSAAGVEVRFVKVPFSMERKPRFTQFSWEDSEGRAAAAARNSAVYHPPVRDGNLTLFDVDELAAEAAVQRCRDVFLLWGAELHTGLTAGWLGLPVAKGDSFLAVAPLWWDESKTHASSFTVDSSPRPTGEPTFGAKTAPTPSLTLKQNRNESTRP
jgi:hypothetical protein